jgi:plasmid maintenance system killer protein
MPHSTITIVNFKAGETRLIFDGFTSRYYPPDIQKIALRKLLLIDAATSVNDLRIPPGNRLEKLVGDRKGNIASASMISGEFALCGPMRTMRMKLK